VAAQSIAYIDYEGNVFPCSYFTVSAGNIFDEPFETIWNSELFESFRDYKKYEGYCGKCRYNGICGGCRARALIESGNHLEQDPYCAYRGEN
jgi:radical SAM protein with 4Fe4S-binding SPASM domain